MKRAFLSFLLASILVTFSTLAGMAVFGIHEVMAHMSSDPCIDAVCPNSGDMGTAETNCLNHCLSVASSATTVVTPIPLAFTVLLITVALFLAESLPTTSRYAPSLERWREGIGKFLLQQNLSTVILRD